MSQSKISIKRIFDFSFALSAIVLSFPLWIVFATLVWLEDRGQVFYIQERVGIGGKLFKSLKFRSMLPDAEKNCGPIQAKENDRRVTGLGRFLRATAMDELPQLWNILKGEMSFVGFGMLIVAGFIRDVQFLRIARAVAENLKTA